jgi:hypothetical protein
MGPEEGAGRGVVLRMSSLRKQGTHNHRLLLLRKVANTDVSPRGRGVWVPAFAGTTQVGFQAAP